MNILKIDLLHSRNEEIEIFVWQVQYGNFCSAQRWRDLLKNELLSCIKLLSIKKWIIVISKFAIVWLHDGFGHQLKRKKEKN